MSDWSRVGKINFCLPGSWGKKKTTWRPPQTSPEVVRYIIRIALAYSMCLGTLVKTSAKWFCGLVVVSTFLKFPIQMNFAENKKWPTSPIWRAAD